MDKIWNRKFILLFITNLLMMATFYASVPIIPIYCQQIGITGSKIGWVLTAMSITTVLFRPFAGYILDNFNRYHVYLLFLGLFCLPFLGFVFRRAYIYPAVHGSCVFRMRFRNNDSRGRCTPARQGRTGSKPICAHHIPGYGGRTLCRHSGAESYEQQSFFFNAIHINCDCAYLRFFLQDKISKNRTQTFPIFRCVLHAGAPVHVQYDIYHDTLRRRDSICFHYGAGKRTVQRYALLLHISCSGNTVI